MELAPVNIDLVVRSSNAWLNTIQCIRAPACSSHPMCLTCITFVGRPMLLGSGAEAEPAASWDEVRPLSFFRPNIRPKSPPESPAREGLAGGRGSGAITGTCLAKTCASESELKHAP